MKTLSRFVAKFTNLIVAVLSCVDGVIFKGYLPFTNGPALEGFVDHVLKIRRCDFLAFAEKQSEIVVENAQRLAQEAGAEHRFRQGFHRKDKLVDEILRQRPILEGLVCVFRCMECCPSFQIVSGKDRPRLVNKRRQQRVLYFYFLVGREGNNARNSLASPLSGPSRGPCFQGDRDETSQGLEPIILHYFLRGPLARFTHELRTVHCG